MTRARSARRVSIAMMAVLAILSALPVGGREGPRAQSAAAVPDSTPVRVLSGDPLPNDEPLEIGPPFPLDARARATLVDHLRQARETKREHWRWLQLGAIALQHAASRQRPPGEDGKEVVEALREACARLSAPELAALAVDGSHPIVSRAFVKAIEREPPRGVAARFEAAAEARDALARFGARRGREFLDVAKKAGEAPDAAGGAQNSVFSIGVLFPLDAREDDFAYGMKDGIQAAHDERARRLPGSQPVNDGVDPATHFEVRMSAVREEAGWTAAGVAAALVHHPGVLVVAGGSELMLAAAVAGRAEGAIVIDARATSAEDLRAWNSDFAKWQKPEDLESAFFQPPLPLDAALAYTAGAAAVPGPVDGGPLLRAFITRPPATERARRLGEALAARLPVGDVAIAMPTEGGGDRALVRGFEMVARVLSRRLHFVFHAPGRRDFTPEVRRFAATGARALLLAGPAEESAEWVLALERAKLKPLLLGSSELDPAGFHDRARAGLEGAIFTADTWEDHEAAMLAAAATRLASAGASPVPPERARGYRLGWTLARLVRDGAYTPTSLALALRDQSLPVHREDPWDPLALVGPGDRTAGKPRQVVLPLYEVRGGEARRLELGP